MIKHIFFDLDRTLWDFEKNAQETLEEIFLNFSLEKKGVNNFESFMKRYKSHNEKLWDLYKQGSIEKKYLRDQRFQLTLEEFNINDAGLAHQIGMYYIKTSPLKTKLFPHCLGIMKYLDQKYKLHIITNGFEEVQHIKLEKSGLTPFFNCIITSEKAGVKKPNSRIFEYAINQAQASIKNSVMIGDDLYADILGAKDVGIDQIYFNPEKNPHYEEVTYEISCLSHLKEIL